MNICVPSLPSHSAAAYRRLLGACAGMLLLLLQLLAPVIGQAATGGEWVEICSEFGAVTVQIGAEGIPAEVPDCPDCDACTLCAALTITPPTQLPETALFLVALQQGFGEFDDKIADNPAQFWPDNRGPPRAKETQLHSGAHAQAPAHLKGEVS